MLDLAAELKDKKKKGIPVDTLRGKNVALILKRPVPELVVLLKWLPMTWAWERLILIPQDLRSARKRVLQIRPVFWEECMRELSTVDMVRRLWKSLQNMQEFRYGTV